MTLFSAQMSCLDTLDQYADNKDTILDTLALLQDKLEVGTKTKYLAVVGNGKTYDHLHALKVEYGQELKWLIPLPGDWHILKNYQEVLFKVYFDGGLREVAKQPGYSDGILNSIGGCSKFKRSHEFILKAWEAILRTFLAHFVTNNSVAREVAQQIKEILAVEPTDNEPSATSLFALMLGVCEDEGKIMGEFREYMSRLSAQDDTCKLWCSLL